MGARVPTSIASACGRRAFRDLQARTATWFNAPVSLRSVHALSAACLLALLGCSRGDVSRATSHLQLTHVRPSNPEGLFLNEDLVFYFSEELDPTSVTSASVEIRSDEGRLARGELRVESDRVRFVPAAVLAPDLSDGAYLPGTKYTATLAGFPRPEGIRSARGDVLEKTWVWRFRTVDVGHPRMGLVFEDRLQDRVGLLRLFPTAAAQGGLIRAQDSIYLACDKPIDPSSVQADGFSLTLVQRLGQVTTTSWGDRVPVRVRVIENDSEVRRRPRPATAHSSAPPEAWEREPRACLIEVTPVRRLSLGTWALKPDAEPNADRGETDPGLRDFGGKPVLVADSAGSFAIRVDDPSAEAGRGVLVEEFDNGQLRSPVAVPGCDGAAYWRESGRVEIRYPAAAGSGEDGAVTLRAREDRTDVQATSIDLPEGSTCRLSDRPGLVVLRCQGRMTIRGPLIREAAWDPRAEAARDPSLVDWWRRCLPNGKNSGQTLSQWLDEERTRNGNWTVLISGGDLEIDDSLTISTPLLLVAGGRIRVLKSIHGVRGTVEVPKQSGPDSDLESVTVGGIYLLGEGGGYGILSEASHAPIVADEPQGANPLAIHLRFAALSGPIPSSGEVSRWLPPESGGSGDRAPPPGSARRLELPVSGSWHVRFVRELSKPPDSASPLETVDSPDLLDPPGPVQFLVELDVEPGGVWNPPWVDYVRLAWEETPPREGPAGGDR